MLEFLSFIIILTIKSLLIGTEYNYTIILLLIRKNFLKIFKSNLF